MRLRSRVKANADGDWEWFQGFEPSKFEVEGRWLQLLNPDVTQSTASGREGSPGFLFHSSELMAVACLLYGNLHTLNDRLPNVSWTETFPYRNSKGGRLILRTLIDVNGICIIRRCVFCLRGRKLSQRNGPSSTSLQAMSHNATHSLTAWEAARAHGCSYSA